MPRISTRLHRPQKRIEGSLDRGAMRIVLRFALLTLTLLPLHPAVAFEWTIRRFDGRDHVPVRQVEEFYGLRPGQSVLLFTKDKREVKINGLRHWLAFPQIEREGQAWISRMDISKTLEPALRPELAEGLKRPRTVILDAGHGGSDKGTIGIYQFEKNFALDLARRVRDELKAARVPVIMTRNSDIFIDLPRRSGIANAREDAIFVSLHFNSAPNRAAEGFEIFCVTPRGAPSTDYERLLERDMIQEKGNASEIPSFVLATAIYHAMHGSVAMEDRGVKRARFAVLRETRIPAVLIENGFLSHAGDAKRIASPEWRNRVAKAIATGILAYLRLTETRTPFPRVAEYRQGGGPPRKPVATASAERPVVSLRSLAEQGSSTSE